MRISDWSSDVCSSDLAHLRAVDRDCLAVERLRARRLALVAVQVAQVVEAARGQLVLVAEGLATDRKCLAVEHFGFVVALLSAQRAAPGVQAPRPQRMCVVMPRPPHPPPFTVKCFRTDRRAACGCNGGQCWEIPG